VANFVLKSEILNPLFCGSDSSIINSYVSSSGCIINGPGKTILFSKVFKTFEFDTIFPFTVICAPSKIICELPSYLITHSGTFTLIPTINCLFSTFRKILFASGPTILDLK
jgi:hypothetical protein